MFSFEMAPDEIKNVLKFGALATILFFDRRILLKVLMIIGTNFIHSAWMVGHEKKPRGILCSKRPHF